jgi:hypothetical protein
MNRPIILSFCSAPVKDEALNDSQPLSPTLPRDMDNTNNVGPYSLPIISMGADPRRGVQRRIIAHGNGRLFTNLT